MLKGKPSALEQVITDATSIEYALNFEPALEEPTEVNVIHKQHPLPVNEDSQKIQTLMEAMTKRLEELETKLNSATKPPQRYPIQPERRRPPSNDNIRTCWLCGEVGHVHRRCPLNDNRPARTVGRWPSLNLTYPPASSGRQHGT